MTDREIIRLKVLEILIPTSARIGIEKTQLLGDDGIAEKFFDFVMKPPAKVSEDTPTREPKKK